MADAGAFASAAAGRGYFLPAKTAALEFLLERSIVEVSGNHPDTYLISEEGQASLKEAMVMSPPKSLVEWNESVASVPLQDRSTFELVLSLFETRVGRPD